MPDELRTNKRAFRDFVAYQSRSIAFAHTPAIRASEDFLQMSKTTAHLRDYLIGSRNGGVLTARVTDAVLRELRVAEEQPSSTRWLKRHARDAVRRWLPHKSAFWIKRGVQSRLGGEKLAFRAYLIEKTTSLLKEDAAAARAINIGRMTLT
jgi:hypothetical protein